MKNTLYLLMLLLFFSCKEKGLATYYKSDFKNNRWQKTQSVTLSFENESSQKANINFKMGYIYGSQFSEIPLEIYITNPLYQIEKIPVTLRLFDKNKNELGTCIGDLCDITQVIAQNYLFDEVGVYKIQILNTFSYEYLPNVNFVSVKIKLSKE